MNEDTYFEDSDITDEIPVVVVEEVEDHQDEVVSEPITTISERIFIHTMIQSVIRGDWGDEDEQSDRLSEAGFSEEQIFNLMLAVSERNGSS